MLKIKNMILPIVVVISLILTLYSQQSNTLACRYENFLDTEPLKLLKDEELAMSKEMLIEEDKELTEPNEVKNINDESENPEHVIYLTIDPPFTNYEKLNDINSKAISEVKLGFPILEGSRYVFRQTSDGFICGNMKQVEADLNSSTQEMVYMIPNIRKVDKSGNVVWQKDYHYKTTSGRLNNLLVLEDDSIIFSVQTYPRWRGEKTIYEKSFIVKCDKDGNQLWTREFDDFSGKMLSNIFATNTKEIIAVGEWRIKKEKIKEKYGKQTKEEYNKDDIVITKMDVNGNIVRQKTFGGSDFERCSIAKYKEGVGIIIRGYTQSTDGDFATTEDKKMVDFIACIDEDLNLKWVVHEKDNESFKLSLLSKDKIYLLKHKIYRFDDVRDAIANLDTGLLLKLDMDGNEIDTVSDIYTGMWGTDISSLENGDIIIGCNGDKQGTLIIFDENGNEKKRIEDLKLSPDEIIPTSDDGFIVKSIRLIKNIPQPPAISVVLSDMEVVITKYSSNYKMQWRKTYDRYKDSTRIDLVQPFKDGSIIIEK